MIVDNCACSSLRQAQNDFDAFHVDQGRFGLFDAVFDKHSAFHRHCAADIEMNSFRSIQIVI